MWIRIRPQEGPKMTIHVPLCLAGSRWIWNMLSKFNGPQTTVIAPFASDMVRELRRYVRRNGHFTLVDVHDSEGDSVTITV